ncbi:MAG: DUF1871 family protein [Lachnospiraceae bacterium]|nr:DUF1871 family protein [Lachnospiraceae bacterium]
MNKIAKIINDWDPIGFFPMAPKNEYANEIEKIYSFISSHPETHIQLLAEEINKIFLEAFERDIYNADMIQCTQIATQILNSNNTDK